MKKTSLLVVLCISSTAYAEEEVRIAIETEKYQTTIQAQALNIFDGDVGDRIATTSDGASITVRMKNKAVWVKGPGLRLEKGKAPNARQIVFEGDDGVRVDGRLYLGRLSAHIHKGRLVIINRLPLETYLLGIVGSEMNPQWPLEALKAQAVAARTYAMQRRTMMRSANRLYDLKSTVLSQVYSGAERIRKPVIDAVSTTRGEVLSYDYRLVEALFHSTCGGRTVPSSAAFGKAVPYLKARQCRWCKNAKRYRWDTVIKLKSLEKSLRAKKLINGTLESVRRKWGQPKVEVRVNGKRKYLSPRKVRIAAGYTEIYSPHFEAKTTSKQVHIKGRGFGHGVGMCQWGAHGLSRDGKNYLEILSHYYKGAKVKKIY